MDANGVFLVTDSDGTMTQATKPPIERAGSHDHGNIAH